LIVQPGASIGTSRMADMSEAYYIISGDGNVTVDGETVAIRIGDAVEVLEPDRHKEIETEQLAILRRLLRRGGYAPEDLSG